MTQQTNQAVSESDRFKEYLKKHGEIAIIWSVEDVLEVRPELNEAQAFEVLTLCQRRHDANIGITWDTLADAADTLFPPQRGGAHD